MTASHDTMTLHDAIFPITVTCACARTYKGYTQTCVIIRHSVIATFLRALQLEEICL